MMNDMLNNLLEASPLLVLVVALNGLGLLLKSLEWHPDKLIPLTLPIVGAVAWVFLGDVMPPDWAKAAKHPNVAHAVIGFVAGAISVWGHQVVSQLVTKKDVQ